MVAEDELTRSAKIALNRWAARYERLENETERLREALAACDVALNWNEPRIVPTADLPDQAAAIRAAREALSRV